MTIVDFCEEKCFVCLCLLNDLVLKGMGLIGKKYLVIYLQVVFSN